MKTEIENILKTLGVQGYLFIENINDSESGFCYNTHPETLIRIMFPIGSINVRGSYLMIEKYKINTWNKSVSVTKVLNGSVLLTNEGEFDSDFYYKILSNINLF